MGNRYSGFCKGTVTADDTHQTLIAATTARPALYDLVVGSADTPADQYVQWHVQRFTAVGTEDAGFTPVAIDPGSPAARCDFGTGPFGAEPTYTANAVLLVFGLNMRATFRWMAAPGGELIAPATANNGLGLIPKTIGAAGDYTSTMMFDE